MNKFFVGTLAAAALTVGANASHGSTITYELLTGTTDYTSAGVTPTSTNDTFITDFFAPASGVPDPQTFGTPTVLKFGDDVTTPDPMSTPGGFATWNNVPISFQFKVDTGSAITPSADTFTVNGVMDGTVDYDSSGNPVSTAGVTYSSISDTDGGVLTTTGVTDPQDHVAAIEITTTINGMPVSIFLDTQQAKAAPGGHQTHSGYIEVATSTPEPGSVAMIVGMGISGGIFLRRKRRA